MDPSEYEQWLSGQPVAQDLVTAGKVLFENLRCDTCHAAGSGQRGPDLAGRFGEQVRMADGQTLLFDESYVRQSILEPNRHVVAGLRRSDADVRGPGHRRPDPPADRLHQDPGRRRGGDPMSTTFAAAPQTEQVNYLNHAYGIKPRGS